MASWEEDKTVSHKIGITANADKPINQYVTINTKNKTQEVKINDIPFQHKRLWTSRTLI